MVTLRIMHVAAAAPEAARALLSAQLDAADAAARAVSEFAWLLSRALPEAPGSCARAYGDLARDLTAVHLSGVRWLFDL